MPAPDVLTPTVLIADHDQANLDSLETSLNDEGYRIVCAEDGDRAMQLLLSDSIDIAVVDVRIPRPSAFAICRAVKFDPARRPIPIVLMASPANIDDGFLGVECGGADKLIRKPINADELILALHYLLRRRNPTRQQENAEAFLFSLSFSVEARDPYSMGHSERLARSSLALARQIGLPQAQRAALRRAGITHDIGKIAIPDDILFKPGPLAPEERRILQRYPVVGEHLCAPVKSFRQVLPIIRHQHERIDGSGYPDGLKGDQIPLPARILSIVDIYHALTAERPYRKALSQREAIQTIREEATRGWWDGLLVDQLEVLLFHPTPAAVNHYGARDKCRDGTTDSSRKG
jgi:putative two-component system response regulator